MRKASFLSYLIEHVEKQEQSRRLIDVMEEQEDKRIERGD